MPVETKLVEYKEGDTVLEGVLAYDPTIAKPGPTVIVFHAFGGRGPFAEGRAKELAKSGYVAFAADVYGKGQYGKTFEECLNLMRPFSKDRNGLLLRRLKAAMETVQKFKEVDTAKIAAIGHCFGGMCVLDMARHYTDGSLKGVVSLHGNLDKPPNPGSGPITAKVLVLHGHCDPFVPPSQVLDFETEMEERKVDWQLHAYGNTFHAFSMPEAKSLATGVMYNESAERRSWQALQNFLKEIL